MKCLTSGSGLLVRELNTSACVNLLEGGKGTAENRQEFSRRIKMNIQGLVAFGPLDPDPTSYSKDIFHIRIRVEKE